MEVGNKIEVDWTGLAALRRNERKTFLDQSAATSFIHRHNTTQRGRGQKVYSLINAGSPKSRPRSAVETIVIFF
jgi:hypothetical protein